ncbi:MAG: hypothetical protein HUJ72_12410 [Blautia sp.]|nr:hypothetical protein [Blautia sp.]
MKSTRKHSSNNLFLIELIISILFLSIVSSICVQLFYGGFRNRIDARQKNHAQELLINTGETLEGTDGKAESFAAEFPDRPAETDSLDTEHLEYYYDNKWNPSGKEHAAYILELNFGTTTWKKVCHFKLYRVDGQLIHQQILTFPVPYKEVVS